MKFVEPTRLELTDSCNPVKCSNHLPVIYKNSNGIALCQYPDRLAICKPGQMLDPSVNLPPVFKPLTSSESHQSLGDNLIREDLKIIAEESITHVNFQNRLTGTLSQNIVMCQHDSICSNAQTLPNDWSREMARLSFSQDQFFLQHTDIGRIIVY